MPRPRSKQLGIGEISLACLVGLGEHLEQPRRRHQFRIVEYRPSPPPHKNVESARCPSCLAELDPRQGPFSTLARASSRYGTLNPVEPPPSINGARANKDIVVTVRRDACATSTPRADRAPVTGTGSTLLVLSPAGGDPQVVPVRIHQTEIPGVPRSITKRVNPATVAFRL